MDNEVRNVFGLKDDNSKGKTNTKFERVDTFIGVIKVLNILISVGVGGAFYLTMHEISYREWITWMFLAIAIGVINLMIGKFWILILSVFVDMCRDIREIRTDIEKK